MLVKYQPTSLFNRPFWATNELTRFANDFNRISRSIDRSFGQVAHSSLAIDWNVSDDEVVISAELPGYTAEDIQIELTQASTLTLSGSRTVAEHSDDDARYLRRERRADSFTRSYKLPFRVAEDDITADFTNGILTIILPRAEADKPRQITVNAS